MAVVLRCSCVLSRLHSGDISRRSRPPAHFHVEKLASANGDALGRPCQNLQIFSSRHVTQLSSNDFHKWSFINQMLCDKENTVQKLSAQQGMGQIQLSAVALIVTNAFMLTAPFEALAAGTCQGNTFDYNMPLLLSVSLVGATVGGLLARQRRGELSRLNEQLRQINAALRRQAKIESYAPTLSYAPVGGKPPEEVIVDPKKHELVSHLKTGKIYLRNQSPDKAYAEFKTALELAQSLKDPIREKKAARGLGASLQRQGKYKDAIKYHSLVLDISEREGENSGNTEAFGAIADCYTELGDLDQAGKFYDKYIARLETD